MKKIILIAAVTALTIGTAAGTLASATVSTSAANSSDQVIMWSNQELPFDRYWSKS